MLSELKGGGKKGRGEEIQVAAHSNKCSEWASPGHLWPHSGVRLHQNETKCVFMMEFTASHICISLIGFQCKTSVCKMRRCPYHVHPSARLKCLVYFVLETTAGYHIKDTDNELQSLRLLFNLYLSYVMRYTTFPKRRSHPLSCPTRRQIWADLGYHVSFARN